MRRGLAAHHELWGQSCACNAAPLGAGQGSRNLSKLLGRPLVGPPQQEPNSWLTGSKSNENWLPIWEDHHRMNEGVSWVREKHSCVISLFSSEENVQSMGLHGGGAGGAQDLEHRPWHGRLAFLLALPLAGGDGLCRLAVVLGQLSPLLGCAGHGMHPLVKPCWELLTGCTDLEHGVAAHACHPLPACKKAVPRWQVIFWKSSCNVFSGEEKEIHQGKTCTYSNKKCYF